MAMFVTSFDTFRNDIRIIHSFIFINALLQMVSICWIMRGFKKETEWK